MKIRKRKIAWLAALLVGLFLFTLQTHAAVPVPSHPANGATVYQTLPYFEWNDVVAHPYVGQYEIQIDDNSDFSSPFDEDTIPAFLSWYSPTVEMTRGVTYYWRVRYIDAGGTPDTWSSSSSFDIGNTYIVDVLTTDGWSEIQAKHVQAADYGHANAQAAELRFPVGHTFNLVQDPNDDYLFEYNAHDNYIINGRGSTIIMQCTQTVVQPKCGFWYVRNSSHLQVRDITIDYTADSLSQFGGVISNLNKTNKTFTVTVDTNVYANYDEASTVAHGYFVDAEHLQRVGWSSGYDTVETWAQARQNDTVFNFTNSSHWQRVDEDLENGDYYISSPVPDRGGDIIMLYSGVTDFVANNVTTNASRGRYFIIKKPNSLHNRCINNDFLRTQGRLRGAASGGVNSHGDYSWYENCTFDYTRDDAIHTGSGDSLPDGPGQIVVRNCDITSCHRGSCWVQMDRHWVADNTIAYAGGEPIKIGKTGQGEGPENCQMDVGLIENNMMIRPYDAFKSGYQTNLAPDPGTGQYNQYVTIRNNTITDHQRNQAFDLEYLKNSTFENNTVTNTTGGWSAYHDPLLEIGIHVSNSQNVGGFNNVVSDSRIDPGNILVVESNCININIDATGYISADITRNGTVDIYDLRKLGEFWLTDTAAADIAPGAGDGIVNMPDLVEVAESWSGGS